MSNEDCKLLKETGDNYFESGWFNEAIGSYTKAIALLSPAQHSSAELYLKRAEAELELNNYIGASGDVIRAIGLCKKSKQQVVSYADVAKGNLLVKCYGMLSQILMCMERFEEARDVCRRGLEIDAKDETILSRLGLLDLIVTGRMSWTNIGVCTDERLLMNDEENFQLHPKIERASNLKELDDSLLLAINQGTFETLLTII
jgi:tetratricopeptide (TPR) repeat protein